MESSKQYAYWRKDKPKTEGYSHELISVETEYIIERGATLDNLEAVPPNGCVTMLQGLRRNCERIPNHDFMGTRNGD